IPGEEYVGLTVKNPILKKMFRKEKTGIVDIKLKAKSGKYFHIELQVEKRKNMKNRVLYYGARLIGDQLKWGDDYDKLHHVVSIVICDHVFLGEESKYLNVYELKNDENRTFTDYLKVVIIELPKLPENEDGPLWPWLKFLKCTKMEECAMLAKKYPQLKKPVKCTERMGLLESIRDYQFHRNLAKVDERMLHEQWKEDGLEEGKIIGIEQGKEIGIKQGIEQGIAQGLAQGEAETKAKDREYFLSLLDQGLSVEEIRQKLTQTATV
ncbi:MAG: Rpn family recombination-promoting nuclease/putative transposase, partial [Treponema sp.]|nr:Rpn family recombination-promoting nuclease/putative transposase [Treponema sp.]